MSQSPPVRLSDVAREAGVSTATVSHALNGKGRITEATRERVRAVADRMGYRPNTAARHLAGGRIGLIAVAFSLPAALPVPLTDVDYFNRAIRAGTARALERGYALVVGPPTLETDVWSQIPLDGVVVFDPVRGDPTVAGFRRRGVPMVLSGRDPSGAPAHQVDNDLVTGTRTVLDHLADRGARRIALLAGDTQDAFADDCVETFTRWCSERRRRPRVTLVGMGRMRLVEEADRVFAGRSRPDAVYATDELLAMALLEAAGKRGLRVPDDLFVVAVGDQQPSVPGPSITTLELDAARTAEECVDLLVDLIEGRPPDEPVRVIPTRLVLGDSTAR